MALEIKDLKTRLLWVYDLFSTILVDARD